MQKVNGSSKRAINFNKKPLFQPIFATYAFWQKKCDNSPLTHNSENPTRSISLSRIETSLCSTTGQPACVRPTTPTPRPLPRQPCPGRQDKEDRRHQGQPGAPPGECAVFPLDGVHCRVGPQSHVHVCSGEMCLDGMAFRFGQAELSGMAAPW